MREARPIRRRLSATAIALALVAGAIALIPASPANATDNSRPEFDRNGDNRADLAVIRPLFANDDENENAMTWYWASFSGFNADVFGNPQEDDIPVVGDFDGDGINDPAVYRPGDPASHWIVLFSSTGFTISQSFAFGNDDFNDVALTGDLNGDGVDDFIIWRPGSPSTWFVLSPNGGGASFPFGDSEENADSPLLGDFNGDGLDDIAIRRIVPFPEAGGAETAPDGTTFFHIKLTNGPFLPPIHFGETDDVYVPGDYDGDGIADLVVVRVVGGNYKWFFRLSSNGVIDFTFGNQGTHDDVLAQNDYDGNGITDLGVWRPGEGAPEDPGRFIIQPLPGSVFEVPFGDSDNYDTPLVWLFNCPQNRPALGWDCSLPLPA